MFKKTIATILMITMLSLSAQVAVGDLQVLKTNTTKAKVELTNYLITEGYTEEEANNLLSNLPDEQIEKVTKEIRDAKKGGGAGHEDAVKIVLVIGVLTLILIIGGVWLIIDTVSD